MKLNVERLRLYDFRNISEADMVFSPGINILYGENAQGKSNILEAIFYLASLKPTRALRETELITYDMPRGFVRGMFNTARGEVERQVTLHRSQKKEVKEGETVKTKWSQLYPLSAVYFSPEDLSIVKGEPAMRRGFLDRILLQIRPSQYKYIQSYYRVLSQRNALLKDIRKKNHPPASLSPWDEQLADLGALLISYRLDLLNRLSSACKDYFNAITGKKYDISFEYNCTLGEVSSENLREVFLKRLNSVRTVDIIRSCTTIGPHRDDVEILIDKKSAKSFASQGQQRILALCLKFSERQILREENGDEPILLLDDVMSELDAAKRRLIIEKQDRQVFITTTDLASIPEEILTKSRRFLVKEGRMG